MSQIDLKSLWGVRGDMDISPTKFQNILCSKTFEFRHAQYPVALYERHCIFSLKKVHYNDPFWWDLAIDATI